MLGGRNLPFYSPQNVGHLHQVVVHNVGKVIGGEAIGLHQNGIAFLLGNVVENWPIHYVLIRFSNVL